MASNSASNSSSLTHRRLRAPTEHGATLHLPDAKHWRQLWDANRELTFSNGQFKHCDLDALRKSGREELVAAAIEFSGKYRNDDFSNRDHNLVVMSGHQPALFHPGVWYKNFVLSELGTKTNSLAINLIVDNDICVTPSTTLPTQVNKTDEYVVGRLNYDQISNPLPFEARRIQDPDTHAVFGELGTELAQQFSQSPILKRLWPHVLSFANDGNLGLSIARGRHKLEEELGLETLELPISAVANTPSFTTLAREIFWRIAEFQDAYNGSAAAVSYTHLTLPTICSV